MGGVDLLELSKLAKEPSAIIGFQRSEERFPVTAYVWLAAQIKN
jgi:hypothetical protein